MEKLTGKQRRHLKGLAHHLDPVVLVGGKGLSEDVLAKIGVELERHELIKVKVLEASLLEAKEAAPKLAEGTGSEVAQVIGRMVILYRPREVKPGDKRPRIRLPEA